MQESNYDFLKISQALGYSTLSSEKIDILENGDEIFPAMLKAIDQAENYIFFETFIFWDGEIAKKFTDLFIKKSKQGVKCYLIFDGFGCKELDKKLIKKLTDNNVLVSFYNSFNWKNIRSRTPLSQRNHRKIMVVDGKTGFIGGVGIADKWLGNARNKNEWRDLHFQVSGEIVNELQTAFLDNWLEYEIEKINPKELYFSKSEEKNKIASSIIISSPKLKYNRLERLFIQSIENATKSINIIAPYFIPSNSVLECLINASKRGVNVEIILPGKFVDQKITLFCSRYLWGRCLKSGIKIYRYQPTFNHTKLYIIDSYWVSTGSSNFDERSLKFNEEANLNIFSSHFAEKLLNVFESDKKKCQEVKYSEWRQRPMLTKMIDWFSSKLRHFL